MNHQWCIQRIWSKDILYFVVYGKCTHTIDFTKIEVPKVDVDVLSKEEVESNILKII